MNYYIQLYSPHGLIRYHDPEIGRNKDTGGQVKYVLELAEYLSLHPQVRKVDLFTRLISDKKVSPAYANEIEHINEKGRIVRIQCGGMLYKEKEQLWPYLDEFVDKTIRFLEKENDFPDIVHGHYADGNYIAGEISKIFRTPFLSTGHSLGRNKRKLLLEQGYTADKANEKFSLNKRIEVEEKTLQLADAIIISTGFEIHSQYKLYEHVDPNKFHVIPPGLRNDIFYPFYKPDLPGFTATTDQELAMFRINSEIERFLFAPEKPLILSIGRADKRKNFETIISCYGQDKELQAMANLAIFAGVRKDIALMPDEERETLTNFLLLMDKYDLYGKMAIPKKSDPQFEIPEIYRLAARKKGVFVNATPSENFGLTLIEAASCGLPVVASPTGGPKEIIDQSHNGLLANVSEPQAIAQALKTIIADSTKWEQYSANGIRACEEFYSWPAHIEKYMELIGQLFTKRKSSAIGGSPSTPLGKRLLETPFFLISDLDGTLVDGEDMEGLDSLKNFLTRHHHSMIVGVSTGRNRKLSEDALKKYQLSDIDILICSVGTELYYTSDLIPDNGWEQHINYQWKKDNIASLLSQYPGIEQQEAYAQTPYKLSYYLDEKIFGADELADLYKLLDDKKLRAKIFITDGKFLDIVPIRAGKGNAVRYLSYKWKTPLPQFITAGNGGNDIDMLRGNTNAIVVNNHSKELNILRGAPNTYFSKQNLAAGVLEGILYYAHTKSKLKILK